MAKILWIGDAGRPTGFATVSHALGERLIDRGHEVHALAVGWEAALPYEGRMKLYRAAAGGSRSYLGLDRTVEVLNRVEPDLVILNEDAPMMIRRIHKNPSDPQKAFLKRILGGLPAIGYIPIDGYGIPDEWRRLNDIIQLVPYTQFAAEQLGIESWIHHGIDPVWRPMSAMDRIKQRRLMDIDDDAFVIGRVDTNSGRKDWGSTWKAIQSAFDLGLNERKTVVVFHTKLSNPSSGVDLSALISRGRGKFIVTNEDNWPIDAVVALVNAFDITLSTSRGEGWGLNLGQSLAVGVPVVATACSSIPEVVGPGGVLIPGIARMTNPYGIDLTLADTDAMASAIVKLAKEPRTRRDLAAAGMEHVKQFDWDASADALNEIIEGRLAQT